MIPETEIECPLPRLAEQKNQSGCWWVLGVAFALSLSLSLQELVICACLYNALSFDKNCLICPKMQVNSLIASWRGVALCFKIKMICTNTSNSNKPG